MTAKKYFVLVGLFFAVICAIPAFIGLVIGLAYGICWLWVEVHPVAGFVAAAALLSILLADLFGDGD